MTKEEKLQTEVITTEQAIYCMNHQYNYEKYECDYCPYCLLCEEKGIEGKMIKMAVKALETVRDLPSVAQQESCEDCVSRQALYESLYEHFHDDDNPSNITKVTLGSVRNFVKNFPSATPMRKKGKWVANHDESDDSHSIDCSCCNYTLVIVVNRGYTAEQALDCVKDMTKNYCPNCGADMREETNESDQNP